LLLISGPVITAVFSCPLKDIKTHAMSSKPDSLAYYYKIMELKADGAYNNIMAAHKHTSDRLAPKILRLFVERSEPQRISFSQGVDNKDGRISFWWYMNEFAVKGEVGEFTKTIETFMAENDYTEEIDSTVESGIRKYTHRENRLFYEFSVSDFVNYTGGPLCGGNVYLRITIETYLIEPFIGDMLKLYPAIDCPVLPLKVAEELKKRKFTNLSYGGTWENYYTWYADVKCLDESEAEMLNKTITKIILASGYRFHEEKDDIRTFIFQEGGSSSFFYIQNDETNILKIWFQPNS
jgi:hypothetical protein